MRSLSLTFNLSSLLLRVSWKGNWTHMAKRPYVKYFILHALKFRFLHRKKMVRAKVNLSMHFCVCDLLYFFWWLAFLIALLKKNKVCDAITYIFSMRELCTSCIYKTQLAILHFPSLLILQFSGLKSECEKRPIFTMQLHCWIIKELFKFWLGISLCFAFKHVI